MRPVRLVNINPKIPAMVRLMCSKLRTHFILC